MTKQSCDRQSSGSCSRLLRRPLDCLLSPALLSRHAAPLPVPLPFVPPCLRAFVPLPETLPFVPLPETLLPSSNFWSSLPSSPFFSACCFQRSAVARYDAKTATCMNNEHLIVTAMINYANDYDGFLPRQDVSSMAATIP